jgi:hypothetical protein
MGMLLHASAYGVRSSGMQSVTIAFTVVSPIPLAFSFPF